MNAKTQLQKKNRRHFTKMAISPCGYSLPFLLLCSALLTLGSSQLLARNVQPYAWHSGRESVPIRVVPLKPVPSVALVNNSSWEECAQLPILGDTCLEAYFIASNLVCFMCASACSPTCKKQCLSTAQWFTHFLDCWDKAYCSKRYHS